MESSEHNWANISETICPEMRVFGKQASWMLLFSEYPDKSHNFTNKHLTLTIFDFVLFLRIYNYSSTTTTPKCTFRSVLSTYKIVKVVNRLKNASKDSGRFFMTITFIIFYFYSKAHRLHCAPYAATKASVNQL